MYCTVEGSFFLIAFLVSPAVLLRTTWVFGLGKMFLYRFRNLCSGFCADSGRLLVLIAVNVSRVKLLGSPGSTFHCAAGIRPYWEN